MSPRDLNISVEENILGVSQRKPLRSWSPSPRRRARPPPPSRPRRRRSRSACRRRSLPASVLEDLLPLLPGKRGGLLLEAHEGPHARQGLVPRALTRAEGELHAQTRALPLGHELGRGLVLEGRRRGALEHR